MISLTQQYLSCKDKVEVVIVNILYIASCSDWHIDLWTKHFSKGNNVYLFLVFEDYLKDQAYLGITVFKSEGVLGRILNAFKFKSQKWYQLNKLLSARAYAKRIDSIIEKYDIEIVHAHSLYYGYVASFIKSDTNIVFTPMGSDVILHAQNNRLYQHMALNAFKKAHIITGDSLLLQKQGYKVGATKKNNYIVQNGVNSKIFFPKANNLRQNYSVADDEILIFSPRAITPLYNIDIILQAIHELVNTGHKIKCMLSFAFGDDYSAQLKKQVQDLKIVDHILWLGYLSYEDMAKHFNAADIVVSVPSSDSSPKSVYEAMFCKKPIVVSDLLWTYELLDDQCITRVGVKSPKELTIAIEKIIYNPEYAQNLADNALLLAKKHFDYRNNMLKMEHIMKNVVYE